MSLCFTPHLVPIQLPRSPIGIQIENDFVLDAIIILRKTITGSDVVNAMTDMEFDKFVRPLENSLASEFPLSGSKTPLFILVNLVWRKSQQTKKDSAAAKKKEKVGAKDELYGWK